MDKENVKDTEKVDNAKAAEEAKATEAAAETAEKPKRGTKKKAADKKVTELEEKVAAAEKEAADFKDRLLRSAAEFDNYRKRTEKEKLAANGNGIASAVEKMLPVLDNLERAADAATSDEAYKKGVLMTVGQFKNAFEALGVKEIEALDKEFDPNYHTAIAQVPSDKESGTVVSVMQKGYMLGDRVIRPSMVSVAE